MLAIKFIADRGEKRMEWNVCSTDYTHASRRSLCISIPQVRFILRHSKTRRNLYWSYWRGKYFSFHPAARVIARGQFHLVLKFTIVIRVRFEIARPDCPSLCSNDVKFDQLVQWFMQDASSMFFGIENAEMEDLLFTENSWISAIYSEVLQIFCAIARWGSEISFAVLHAISDFHCFFKKTQCGGEEAYARFIQHVQCSTMERDVLYQFLFRAHSRETWSDVDRTWR